MISILKMRLLLFLFAVIITLTSSGQNCSDTVTVYFTVGHRNFDQSLRNNRKTMNNFIKKVKDEAAAGNLERIVVYGYASPEGQPQANEKLARNRCSSIADYIINHTGIEPALVEKRPSGIGWSQLRQIVSGNSKVPYQKKVLNILDNTPVWIYNSHGKIVDGRKKQLMDLAGGRSWNWMKTHIFPELRNAVAISLYCKSTATSDESISAVVTDPEVLATDSVSAVGIESTGEQNSASETDNASSVVDLAERTIYAVGSIEQTDSTYTAVDNAASDTLSGWESRSKVQLFDSPVYIPDQRFALKTNLLYYGLLLPNIELEWKINNKWSVAIEGNFADWGKYERERSYRITLLDAEARRWFKTQGPWHGMYAGVVAGGGIFDIEKGSPGYYGHGLLGGLTYGYMWPINDRLSFEAELGLGYAFIRYKEYIPLEGHHVYQLTKNINYFGPIKLKFSIVWRFVDPNKPKRIKPTL